MTQKQTPITMYCWSNATYSGAVLATVQAHVLPMQARRKAAAVASEYAMKQPVPTVMSHCKGVGFNVHLASTGRTICTVKYAY